MLLAKQADPGPHLDPLRLGPLQAAQGLVPEVAGRVEPEAPPMQRVQGWVSPWLLKAQTEPSGGTEGRAWRAGRGDVCLQDRQEAQSLVFRAGRGGTELEEQRRIGGSETGRASWSRWRPRGGFCQGRGSGAGGRGQVGQRLAPPTGVSCSHLHSSVSRPQETTRARTAAAPRRLGLWGGG